MTSKLGKYITTIIGILVTIGLSFVSDFVLRLPLEITWLTFFTGSIVTVATTLLEQNILARNSAEINRKLEIYGLLEQIEDPEIYQLASATVTECIEKLKKYKAGIIPSTTQAHLTDRLSKCNKSLKSTYWVPNLQALYLLEDDFVGRNYYELNVQALKRGVTIERIFLFNQEDVFDEGKNHFDEKALHILKQQQNDGVNVRVSWIRNLQGLHYDPELHQDFGIFDEYEVMLQLHGVGNSRHGTMLIKQPEQVKKYQIIFQKIWKLSRPIDEILNQYA